MKTKNIFKTVALAMLMPAMLLTTACSNQDDVANTSNITNKGYALPVTVNVTRGDGATRATYTDNGNGTGSLAFGTGDKLFVKGSYNEGEYTFAGMLDYVSDGKFSGTIMTQTEWAGTNEELLSADGGANATLLPAGYGEYGYLSIADEGTYEAWLSVNYNKAFATSKATAVEQFSWEDDNDYSSGFELTPVNAILNFTINGLDASTEVDVSFSYPNYPDPIVISGKVTTDGDGTATFAIGIIYGNNLKDCTLTVDGNNIAMPTKTTEAGHIYNISRSVAPATDLSTINANYTASNGETLTGTLANNVKISIADGATVILNGVSINANGGWTSGDYAGITCEGDATIILEGTNTVKGFDGFYPGIYVPVGSTVTINGSGSLTASSNGGGAGIGGGWDIDCGNIEIQGGTITATAGNEAAGIGGGRDANCGNITISGGTVTATGGDYAAGIGSGTCSEASCGSITISGGTVTATGGEWAPGIGSSAFGSSCGAITITSGVTHVTATKGEEAPNSIGAGDMGSSCGTVSIEDPSKVTQN